MEKYSFRKNLLSDIPAAIVVFLVALPLCLGIALGSGAPLFSGIIAGIVGGIVIGSLSGSQLSISGPAAGLTAIVVAAIGNLQVFEAFLVAVVLGGILQMLFGFLKAGVLGDYIPSCVIKGMLAAIGLILILKQFPHLVGYDANFQGDESFQEKGGSNTFLGITNAFKAVLPAAILIGAVALLIQLLWDKVLLKKAAIFKLIPAPLVVVVVGIMINEFLMSSYPEMALKATHLVNIPVATSFDSYLGFFTFPDFNYLTNFGVWKVALTIAIVASLETLLNIEASDELDPYQRVTPKDRELRAQGVGNIVSGMLGGLPVTSVIVRTSANVNAGGKTKTSAILHGVLLLLSVAFIASLLNKIPLAALAGILIYTGYKLTKVAIFKDFYKKGWTQFVPFVVTVLAILLTDLLIGILIGCLVGLFYVMRSNFRSAFLVVRDENKYLFRLRKDVSFLNKPIIKNQLEKVPANSFVLIDATRADFIDKDVAEVIEDFMKHAHLKDIKVDLRLSEFKDQGFSVSLDMNGDGTLTEVKFKKQVFTTLKN